MIVGGSQVLISYPFILVKPRVTDAVTFLQPNDARVGTVIDVYSACDWVLIDSVVGYKSIGVIQLNFNNIVYDLVPKENILLTYIPSVA